MRRSLSLVVLIATVGCEGGPAGVFSSLRPTTDESSVGQLEAEYREKYLTERDPEALRWLLANKVRQGMSVAEVNGVLGEDGQREFDDARLKAGNNAYRADDLTYRWGPDSSGRAVFLMFRDRKLLNFDPQEFADAD